MDNRIIDRQTYQREPFTFKKDINMSINYLSNRNLW